MKPAHREIDRITKVTEESCMAIVNWVVGRLNEPIGPAEGEGIVMVAGGARYSKEAYVTLSLLRERGCTLPVQIWHLGPREINDHIRAKFQPLDVEFVDAFEVAKKHPMRRLSGWECKSFAVKHCPFRHVLLLDSDSHPVIEPADLFKTPAYEKMGAIFFPDIAKNRKHDRIFPCLGLKVGLVDEHEAGQVLVDKVQYWKEVCLTVWMNSHSDCFYKMLHGDKDLWGLSWARLGTPFLQAPKCTWEGWGIRHYWFDGRPAFDHHMARKRESDSPIPLEHMLLFREFDEPIVSRTSMTADVRTDIAAVSPSGILVV